MENKEEIHTDLDKDLIHTPVRVNVNENRNSTALRTPSQEVLVVKILQSRKLLDGEYQQLRKIWLNQVVTSKDAAIFIEYVLATLRFRRCFLDGKHNAFKRCQACNSRDKVRRYDDLAKLGPRYWLCETCALNLSTSVVPVKEFKQHEI